MHVRREKRERRRRPGDDDRSVPADILAIDLACVGLFSLQISNSKGGMSGRLMHQGGG